MQKQSYPQLLLANNCCTKIYLTHLTRGGDIVRPRNRHARVLTSEKSACTSGGQV